MTTSRSPKPNPRPSLPMIAATTAALPAVVLSSLAIAQPAAAESRPRAIPATLAAAMQAQAQGQTARSLASALIPAGSVPATVPSAFRPAQVSAPAEYTIARGDTISGIAGKFGLDTYAVLKLNGLQANTIIYPGQKIKLDGSAAPPAAPAPAAPAPAAPAGGSVYTVKSGRHPQRDRRPPRRQALRGLRLERAQHGLDHPPRPADQDRRRHRGTCPVGPGPGCAGPVAPAPAAPAAAPRVGFLHHQVRRHPLRHRRQERRQARRHPLGQPPDDEQHHLPRPEARAPGRVHRSGVHPARCHGDAARPEHLPRLQLPGRRRQLRQPEQGPAERLAGAQPRTDEDDRGGHRPPHGRRSRRWPWPSPSRSPASTTARSPPPTRSAPCRSSRPRASGPRTSWAAS